MTTQQAFQNALRHHQAGRLAEAESIYRQILALEPRHADALHLLGLAAHQAGRPEAGVALIRQAIALRPDRAAGYYNDLGGALRNEGKREEALACFQQALELEPDSAETHNNLGVSFEDQGLLEEAISCYHRALGLDPGLAQAHKNLGNALRGQGKMDEAVDCCRRALDLKPDFAGAYKTMGLALRDAAKLEEAVVCLRRALELRPGSAEARQDLGIVLLQLGHYAEAWAHYESRLALLPPRTFASPRWKGELAEGQTILLCCEQGFGDSLQFVRYAALVRERARARRVILECPPPLARLLAHSVDLQTDIVTRGSADETAPLAYDWHLPLLSAPWALGVYEPWSTDGPYLRTEPDLRERWRNRLGPRTKFRVGLAWKGNPAHLRDRARSLAPESFLPLLRLGGVACYSLQVDAIGPETAALRDAGLIDLTAEISDFADTAALMSELDLVITVDTATLHLAGALGRPVWAVLPISPHWSWGLNGESTPWYPTMRLFRQPAAGAWEPVLRRIGEELARVVNGKR